MDNNKRYIEIPSNDDIIYRHILEFLLVGTKFTNQEKDVLAEYIKLSHEYEALPTEKRNKFIFSQEIRKEVAAKVNIKDANQVATVISTIKSKDFFGFKLIDEDNNILENLLVKPDLNKGDYNIIINFIKTQPINNLNKNEKQIREDETPGSTIEGDFDSIEAAKLAPIDRDEEE